MKRRMKNIIKDDNRTFLVAMDHGTGGNVLPFLENPGEVIKECRAGGADGFLASIGIATRYVDELGDATLLVRADGSASELFPEIQPWDLTVQVADAIRAGADGVVCMDFPGSEFETSNSNIMAKLVSDCAEYRLPLGVETLPRGFEFHKHEDCRTPENLILAARMGCEKGADFIKTQYTGDKESFGQLVRACYRPVVILGGGNMKEPRALLQEIRDALDSGAAGVLMGRNIYRSGKPRQMCEAIAAMVHKDATVDDSLKIMQS